MKQPVERRLAAILAADVAGYSRLMGADEEGTLDRLKAHRRQLVDPKIREHRGRIVKTTGDGMLVEFASVVDAVRCAVEMQRAMVDRNAEMPEDRRITFRIGINLGDVIIDGDDIFGDGVNIAARLEALAEPGGICISRTVHDQIRDKLPYPFEDMGEQSVKNIARPVRADAMSASAVAATPLVAVKPARSGRGTQPSQRRRSSVTALRRSPSGSRLGGYGRKPDSPVSVQAPARQARKPRRRAKRPRRVCRSSSCPLPTCRTIQSRNISPTAITDDLTTDLSHIVGQLCDRPHHCLHLQGQAGRCEADRPRARRSLCP